MPPEEVVHSSGGLLRVAGHCLDIDLEVPLQELVHLPIIVVIISDGKTPTALFTLRNSLSSPPYPTEEEQRVARKVRR
jgi:hypothetical protein